MMHQEMQLSGCCCSGPSVSVMLFQMAASAVTQIPSSLNCVMKGEEDRQRVTEEQEKRKEGELAPPQVNPPHLPSQSTGNGKGWPAEGKCKPVQAPKNMVLNP